MRCHVGARTEPSSAFDASRNLAKQPVDSVVSCALAVTVPRSWRRSATLLATVLLTIGWVTTSGTAQAPPAASKPVSFAVLEDYDKGDDLDAIARDFALMRELGVTTWRGRFGWDDYEPTRGKYDFTWLERFITRARQEGITLRPYVASTPEWAAVGGGDGQASNDPPRSFGAWSTFLTRLTSLLRRHPNVASLEIYNEPNVKESWDGGVDQYVDLLQRAVSVSRAATRLQLFHGGLVVPDAGWIERVCDARSIRNRLHAITLHAYPETGTQPEVTVESYLSEGYRSFVQTADATCGRKPVWINKTGFATTPGRSEREQANWWARAIATFLAEPRVEHIGIYEIKDLRLDKPAIGDASKYHLGLTYSDRRRKLAFRTIDLVTDLLDTGTITVADDRLRVTSNDAEVPAVFRHLFVRPDGQQVAFVWSRTAVRVSLQLLDAAQAVREYQLDGTILPGVTIRNGVIENVALTDNVVRIFVVKPVESAAGSVVR